jgi:U3 small nucleolar RNA-associated protein 10
LELSLRSDARDGGNWVRSDSNRRFHALMHPLGQLLIIVPTCCKDHDRVAVLVDATIQCLTALAAAAGTEELWKPLNHAVLQAASHDHSVECRKAGLQCLLSLIKALGEEYMVLLPECLPVLSERLEDEEEVAALARECITLAEELIGESLEDNL